MRQCMWSAQLKITRTDYFSWFCTLLSGSSAFFTGSLILLQSAAGSPGMKVPRRLPHMPSTQCQLSAGWPLFSMPPLIFWQARAASLLGVLGVRTQMVKKWLFLHLITRGQGPRRMEVGVPRPPRARTYTASGRTQRLVTSTIFCWSKHIKQPSDSRRGEKDSILWWEKQQSPIAQGSGRDCCSCLGKWSTTGPSGQTWTGLNFLCITYF